MTGRDDAISQDLLRSAPGCPTPPEAFYPISASGSFVNAHATSAQRCTISVPAGVENLLGNRGAPRSSGDSAVRISGGQGCRAAPPDL